jgi:hypothetical protein
MTKGEEGANVLPVYIKASNPFDYENVEHMNKLVPQFKRILKTEEDYSNAQIDEVLNNFREGRWTAIEHANDYDLFETNGFDAFYVKEQGRKNLGVFRPEQVKSAIGNYGTYESTSPDIRKSLRAHKDLFDRADEIPMSEGVETIRDNWIGGVSGVGNRDGMYDLYRVEGGPEYTSAVQRFVRSNLGDSFKGYRLMSPDELEELKTAAMGSQFVSFSLNPDVAKAFKNLPAYAKRKDLVVVEMDLTPEHVHMIGHPEEQELVVDYGQGYNPEEIKVIGEEPVRKSLRTEAAGFTPERIDSLINEYGYTDGRTYGFAAFVNPKRFIAATVPSEEDARRIYEEAGELDVEELRRETQTPFLYVDMKTGRIEGHEGRHRMAAMDVEGIKSAPVVIVAREDQYKKPAPVSAHRAHVS